MTEPIRAVVVGASSGVGRAITEELAHAGASLLIASRGHSDLEVLASHLRLTTRASVTTQQYDLRSGSPGAGDLCSRAEKALGKIDAVFLTAAEVIDEDRGLSPPEVADGLVDVNMLGPIHLLSAFAETLERQGTGAIVVFSSIAAAIPRRNNTVYSATKLGLEGFCRGMRHYLSNYRVRVQIYRLGYVDTTMAAGRTRIFPKAKPETVARHVIRHLEVDFGLSYYPRYWRLVVLALRLIPWSIFRRLDF